MISSLIKRLQVFFKDPLYKNAAFLIVSSSFGAVCGFVFWIVVARFYSPEIVGFSSALFSAASLLIMFSNLGLGFGLIRYLRSSKDPNKLINSIFSVVSIISIIAGTIFVIGVGAWSPGLKLIRENLFFGVIFVAFILINNLFSLIDQTFIANRRADFVLSKNVIFNVLRLIFPIVLLSMFGKFGIFISWSIAITVPLFIGLFFLLPKSELGYRPAVTIDRKLIVDILHFSFSNYLGDLSWNAPTLILPIIVINTLGPAISAFFFIAWAIGSIINTIANMMSTSLFAEGSNNLNALEHNLGRSIKMILLLLIPIVAITVVFADKILVLFGSQYSENATDLLRLLAIANFPFAINVLYFAQKRVEKKTTIIVILAVLSGAITIGLSELLLTGMGITGVGIAFLSGQCTIAVIIIIDWLKKRSIIRKSKT